jgi:hypothetical protein
LPQNKGAKTMKKHPIQEPAAPHPYKLIFKKHGIPISRVAQYFGFSYNRIISQMNGYVPLGEREISALEPLVRTLEDQGGK